MRGFAKLAGDEIVVVEIAIRQIKAVRVTGRRPAGEEQVRALAGEESTAAANKALEGLSTLIARYDDPAEPYRSRVAPQFVKEHPGDYAHLARVFEWSTSGDDGEGE